MFRPIKATIHMNSLRHNVAKMKELANGRFLWAVAKADAYGHGLERVIGAFSEADGLAIIDIADIERARRAGWTKPILLLQGFFDEEGLAVIEKHEAEVVIHNEESLAILEQQAPFKELKVHIKINSGMNRFGFLPKEEPKVRQKLQSIEGVKVMGVVTHFANSCPKFDYGGPVSVKEQMQRLGEIATRKEGACFANSAALLWLPECGGDAVRAGISLYGISPEPGISSDSLGLKPAMTLSSKILAIQTIAPGEAVGYCSRFIAQRESRIAVVACGFADGYMRGTAQGTPVWVEGQFASIVGNIAMDVMTIDVTDIPEAKVGSDVELWGEHIHVEDLAARAGTIAAEITCALTKRVPVVTDEN